MSQLFFDSSENARIVGLIFRDLISELCERSLVDVLDLNQGETDEKPD
jgi:hypothetical protein